LALHRDEDLDHLDDAGREFVALSELGDLLLVDVGQNPNLPLRPLLEVLDLGDDVGGARARELSFTQSFRLEADEHLACDGLALGYANLSLDREVCGELAPLEQFVYARVALLSEYAHLVFEVAAQAVLFLLLDGERALVA